LRKVVKDLAIQRSYLLFNYAVDRVKKGDLNLARRYIELGLKLLRKANASKPYVYRRYVCKNCYIPLIPGLTARVRIKSNKKQIITTTTCLMCGWVSRKPCEKRKGR